MGSGTTFPCQPLSDPGLRSRSAFAMTDTELRLVTAAISGLNNMPVNG